MEQYMTQQNALQRSWLGFGLGLGVVLAHLAWEFSHGGVRSHHLLNSPDLPAISNWWGLLVLPLLGWVAAYAVARRLASQAQGWSVACSAWLGALLLGLALSGAFLAGYTALTTGLFFTVLAAGLVLPTYRLEYLFGFVLGMTFVFGAVLPAIVATVAATLSGFLHRLLYPTCVSLLRRARA
jgi:hypothetical protein